MPPSKNRKYLAVALACLAAAAFLGMAFLGWTTWNRYGRQGTHEWSTIHDPDAVERTKQQAAPLIEAIERFRTTSGHLPGSLNELTPTFIAELPTPQAGQSEFRYRVNKDTYSVRFGAGAAMYPGYEYDAANKQWHADF